MPSTLPNYLSIRTILAVALSATLCFAAFAAHAQQDQNTGSRGQLRQACAADFKTYCSDVQRGGGRIFACLKQNESKLSQPCQQALAAAMQAREQRQQQQNNSTNQ